MRSPLTEKYLPKKLEAQEYDAYLALGWYRLGSKIFTTQYLFMGHKLYSPVWIRLPLQGYQFRKSLRKIINRCQKKFSIVYRPQRLDEEKETLYQRYRKEFNGRLSLTLISYLQDAVAETVFNTMECCVYEGDRLVACSFFDLGDKSLSSIVGIHDPEYGSNSLGIFTMLMEMKYGQEHGFELYYPGYIVPGNSRFDYKLRIGDPKEVQFWNIREMEWQVMTAYDENRTQTYEIGHRLGAIRRHLRALGIEADILFYPSFEPEIVSEYASGFNDSPLFLSCFSGYFLQPKFMVFYDYFKETFQFYYCEKPESATVNAINEENASDFRSFFDDRKLVIESADENAVVKAVLMHQAKALEISNS